jgi:tetratricopeptide (TPR) repeat protein
MDPVLITGALYRKAQLKGYQQYQRFLDSIVADSTHFVDRYQLEMFLQRNIPELYRFRSDSSDVSDHEFASAYGVTQQQALEHYTNQLVVRRNRRKVQRKEAMFHRLVKVPILTEGLRLDTVIQDAGGDIIYDYVQTIQVRPGVRKAVVTLRGQIFEEDKAVYRIPAGDPLTFYISSLSTLCDGAVRYKTKVIERRVEAHTACYIAFAQGKSDIRPGEGNNAEEMGRIRRNLASLAENREFDLDSIVVTASCSPEGSFTANRTLSRKRSESVSAYFEAYLKQYRDSLERERGAVVDLAGEAVEKPSPIRFLSYENPENWEMLDRLVETDTLLSEAARSSYRALAGKRDPDQRERALQGQPFYRHLREALYPRLRTVKFDFHLHRKGMVKDTVHTTVVDSVYMDGLVALRDHDYQRAVTLLRPYRDYNSAVAYCSLGYNASALDILERLDPTDRVLYLLSILYSRTGEDRKAVECYMKACRENPSYVHRGNLDPEISALIKHYGLNTN